MNAPRVVSAGALIGDRVRNPRGEDLGTIEHLMIDISTGRVSYAVLSFGGFMGLGDKLFAIPWTALTLDADNDQFLLDVPRERLENAPGFDKDNWPTMADPQWVEEIHAFYSQRPLWE